MSEDWIGLVLALLGGIAALVIPGGMLAALLVKALRTTPRGAVGRDEVRETARAAEVSDGRLERIETERRERRERRGAGPAPDDVLDELGIRPE
jgi:hypothetical protein